MMILNSPTLSRVVLVRPGATEFDEQGRIKGSMDMPMSDRGRQQVQALADQVGEFRPRTLYTSPCESARETAGLLARGPGAKLKVVEGLRNVDHGLWHGKLIDELRRNHPKLYRCGQETPWDICPPGGESVRDAQTRASKALRKVLKKANQDLVVIVVPDPMAWIVQSLLSGEALQDLWKAQTDAARWDLIEPVW